MLRPASRAALHCLQRIEKREFHGVEHACAFIRRSVFRSGLHVYKHLCSEFSRTAHLLEFRRHVLVSPR